MRRVVVISQPMFFPWVGLFEQIRLADAYVHYDDVQYPKGYRVNRVQVKTCEGQHWLTVPLRDFRLGQTIAEVQIDNRQDWRAKHLALLSQAYERAPYCREMIELVQGVYEKSCESICELAIRSIDAACRYFGLDQGKQFHVASRMNVPGKASQRVLDVVRACDGNVYVTGHGALQYLDHDLFEVAGVRVEYMDYQKTPYPQLHGEFTPFVSILDLIANCGPAGGELIHSPSVYWQEMAR